MNFDIRKYNAMDRFIYILSGLLICCLPVKAQWQLIDTIDHANYMNLHFHDADNGILSGEMQGRFFKTANGGQSWNTIHVPFIDFTTDYLVDMQFVNKDIGFVCGGSGYSLVQSILMRTTNGGLTWDSIASNIPGAMELHGMDFKITDNSVKGIVFSYAGLFRSTDTGKTLVQLNKPLSLFYIEDAVYLGDSTLLVTGHNNILNKVELYKTYDWGNNWQLVHTDSLAITSLAFSGQNGFGASWKGNIIKTTDGGSTWTKVKIAAEDISFTRVKYGANGYPYLLATNWITNSGGYVYGSDNNGLTWHSVLVDSVSWLTDISMPSTGTGYVMTNRRLYKTTTGGGLDLQVSNPAPRLKDIKLYPNPSSGWLNIDAPASVEIKNIAMYNAAGKCVGTWEGRWQRVNIAGFARGTYYMRIETGEDLITKKLLLDN